ncbi:MAG: threonine synthase, partial [candidate division Zixibacteria bacterium]|nr:threonine synthase [candidate division Zixibacteria bacterium]
MPASYTLRCGWCDREYDPNVLMRMCTDCARPLLATYDLDPTSGSRIRASLKDGPASMWRYADVLPVHDSGNIITLGEGMSPMLPARRLGERLKLNHLWVMDESQNPTGSFKARGMSAAVSKAVELGATQLCLPSAGNAAGAAAAYGAMAGCRVRVYMPDDSGDAFFSECRTYGAEVHAVNGSIADCGKQMAAECDPDEWFDLSTLKEPYRLEGKKTMGYELFEQFDGSLPDVIVYPTGGGTGLIGMWKAFDEMQRMGWIGHDRPKMISIQTTGCAPIVRAFESGSGIAEPIASPRTAALGLRVPSAVGDFLILRAIRASQGAAIAVTEEEWHDGQIWLGED